MVGLKNWSDEERKHYKPNGWVIHGVSWAYTQLFFFFGLRNITHNLIPLIWRMGQALPGQEFQLSTIQWLKSTMARMDKHLFITMKGQMFTLVNRWILLGIIHTIFFPLRLNHQRFQLAWRSVHWSYYMSQVFGKLQERPIENHTQSQSSPFVLQKIRNGPINNHRGEEGHDS